MIYEKEIVNEPDGGIKIHLSENIIKAEPFALAKVKQGGYGMLENDFWLQRVANRGFHVFFLTVSGSGQMTFEDGTVLKLNAGDLFISWSTGQGHHEMTIGDELWEMVWFTVWDDSPRFNPTSIDWEVRKVPSGLCRQIRDSFINIIDEDSYNDRKSYEVLSSYENIFLIYMERALGMMEDEESSIHRVELAKLWQKVANNPNKDWSLRSLSEQSGFSKSHLTRLCHMLYGKSPGQMVSELLMHQAKVFLRNSDLSISDISESLGFSSTSSFSTAFRNFIGVNPREYRKNKPGRNGT